MAIKTLSLASVRPFVSKFDPGKGTSDETKFQIGNLDSRVLGTVKDKVTTFAVDHSAPGEEAEASINTNAVNFELVAFGVRGWSNLQDDKGNDVPFKTVKKSLGGVTYDVVAPECLKVIPLAVVTELAGEVERDNVVSAAEGNVSG